MYQGIRVSELIRSGVTEVRRHRWCERTLTDGMREEKKKKNEESEEK